MPQLRGAALSADVDGCIVRDCAPRSALPSPLPDDTEQSLPCRRGAIPPVARKPWIVPNPGTRKLHRREENSGAA
jgi:hypothetical protein